jgi:hypothetical protein
MNGPRDAGALTRLYPRLRSLGTISCVGVSLQELLMEVVASAYNAGAIALALDVPGQEVALLRSLPSGLLHKFEWIALRSASASNDFGWDGPQVAAACLEESHFKASLTCHATDAAWPVSVFYLDAPAVVRDRIEAPTRHLDEHSTRHAKFMSNADPRSQRVPEHTHEREELHRRWAEATSKVEQQAEQIKTLSHERDQARKDLERLTDELAQLRLRQRLTSQEVIRAEGQIELIKDVLLRGSGL